MTIAYIEKKGDFMADYYNSLINKEESDIAPNAITTCYLTSIKLDGSIFNKAWVNLLNILPSSFMLVR